jgi:FMNH2-dependent dimethyl sulfone monooxygenase
VLHQPFMLGLFLPIQSGGWTASTLPRGTDWRFSYNAELAKQAEALGFDLVFGLSQWLPKGGYNEVQDGQALDSFITIAAMAAITSRILLISTVHVLYGPWHPLHFAKFGATLDHIANGRWGVNVVTGHRAVEHEMFGWPRIEHDKRYELAGEFLDAVLHLWQADDNVNLSGTTFAMKGAYVTPKPQFGRPVLVNATGSAAGIGFAAHYSDIVFITSPTGTEFETALAALPAHVAAIKAQARVAGREVRTIINPMVILGETDEQAEAYADEIVAHGAQAGFHSGKFDSDAQAWAQRASHDTERERRLGGGNIQIIGGPKKVAESMARLHAAGVDGAQLSFYDFAPDLERFGRLVLPLLPARGLRL